MGDAKMKWDEKYKRWRRGYRGKRLIRTARQLGGTNATDTKVAANKWFEKAKAKRDAELGPKTRPHEADYRAELESLQVTEEQLRALRQDPKVAPVIGVVRRKKQEIEQRLKGRSLKPLDKSLRNPLELSVQEIEERAARRAMEAFLPTTAEDIDSILSFVDYLRNDERGKYELYSNEELRFQLTFLLCNLNPFADPLVIDEGVVERVLPADLDTEERRAKMVDMILGLEMYSKIVMKLYGKSTFETIMKEEMKEETGTMQNDYERGALSQKLNLVELEVSEDRNILKHIDNFENYQKQRVQTGRIGEGQLDQVLIRIRHYRKWLEVTGISDVESVAEVQHANAYFDFQLGRMQKKEIGAGHMKKLFATFRTFVEFLVDESILKAMPNWMNRKDDRYKVDPKQVDITPIEIGDMRRIYDAAPPPLRLFMLLALNCGFGQAEAGRLKTSEYDPVAGTITHRRIKTGRSRNTPVVTYRLWSRTREYLEWYLEQEESFPVQEGFEEHLLITREGIPFWMEWRDGEGLHKRDAIAPMFENVLKQLQKEDTDFPKYGFYQLRKTSSTAIYNNREFNCYNSLWLGHASRTTGEKHYSRPNPDILDECLAWLETELFESEVTR